MVGLEFEGFVDGIQPRQREFVENVLQKLGYNAGVVKIAAVGKAGDNYAADVRRFVIEKNGQTLKLVGKIASGNEMVRMTFSIHHIFMNEHLSYDVMLPKYKELEEAARVPENDRFTFAKFHGSVLEEPNEIILLEDLQVGGYTMLDRFKPLPNEAVRLVLKDFAAIHSLSYVWKTKEPETYQEHTSKIYNMWDNKPKVQQMAVFFDKLEEDTIAIVKEEKYAKYLRGLWKQMTEVLEDMEKREDEQYQVILQGDSWTNNIMFRLEDGKPVQSCMIDYQMTRLSSPAVDLGYFLFNCTDHAMRMNHFHDWIDFYHSHLDKYLSYYGLKSEVVYPREQLDKELSRFAKLSLVQGVLVGSVIVREVADAQKFKDAIQQSRQDNFEGMIESSKVSGMEPAAIAKYRIRTEELIDSLLALDLLTPK